MKKLNVIKIVLLSSIVFSAGCDITFKKKSHEYTPKNEPAQVLENEAKTESESVDKSKDKKESKNKTENTSGFSAQDKQIIQRYYSDTTNAKVKKAMLTHSQLTKKQIKSLKISKTISNDIQIVPLPLELERILTLLPSSTLRVQAGKQVMLMEVNSRKILDLIKI